MSSFHPSNETLSDSNLADDVEREFYLTRAQAVRTTFAVIVAIEFCGSIIHLIGTDPETRAVESVVVALNLVFFVALWWWSGRRPLAASITGLSYILGASTLAALADPTTLAQGLVVRLLVLAALIKGVRDGLAHRHFERLVKKLS